MTTRNSGSYSTLGALRGLGMRLYVRIHIYAHAWYRYFSLQCVKVFRYPSNYWKFWVSPPGGQLCIVLYGEKGSGWLRGYPERATMSSVYTFFSVSHNTLLPSRRHNPELPVIILSEKFQYLSHVLYTLVHHVATERHWGELT